MDRDSERGDPAEAGGTWFDTPGEASSGSSGQDPLTDPPPREPTWFDGPAQRKSLAGQGRPDPVNAGLLARATGLGGLVDPQRAVAVLADVLRDGLLPEPKASEAYWKLAGLTPPTEAQPYATRIAPPPAPAGPSPGDRRRHAPPEEEIRARRARRAGRYAKGVSAVWDEDKRGVREEARLGKIPTDREVAPKVLVEERTIVRWRAEGDIGYADEVDAE